MKAKNVFLSIGLSLAMGASLAAAGIASASKEISQANAEATTIYAQMQYDWWTADGAAIGIYAWGDGGNLTSWPGARMTSVDSSNGIWSYSLDISTYPNVIFTRVNASGNIADWGAKTQDLTFPTDGKNIFTITTSSAVWGDPGCEGTWATYPFSSTISVNVYVNGTLRGSEDIYDGSLPTNPETGYGKTWDGVWYTDSGCTTACTGVSDSVTELYCTVTDVDEIIYNIDVSRATDKFATTYLYTWDAGGVKATWPGELFTSSSVTVASDAYFIINAGDGNEQTVNITGSGVANDTLRVLNSVDSEGHYEYAWESTVDEPSEDGYYLVSSKGDYKYASGTKMSTENLNEGNNAELYSYSAVSGEGIKVRYYNASEGKDAWSYSGDAESDLGAPDTDLNYVLKKDAVIDIYAKWEETSTDVWEIKFYVTEHVDRYEVSILFQLFEGSNFASGESGVTQYAYAGSEFTPTDVTRDGYVFRGFFTDSDCTVVYTAAVQTGNVTIYAKFTKIGYYVISGAGSWSIDNATIMMTEGIGSGNKAEASIIVAAADETYSFVYYDGSMAGHSGLGATYDYAVDEEDHIKFSAAGTYAVYWSNSDNKIYLNAGITAFETNFLSKTAGVCKTDNSTNLDSLKAVWAELATEYSYLTDDEKAQFEALTIDSGNEEGELIEQVIARYSYIVKKYGTTNCADFIWGDEYAASSNGLNILNVQTNVVAIVLIASSFVAITAVGVYFIVRRRKLAK